MTQIAPRWLPLRLASAPAYECELDTNAAPGWPEDRRFRWRPRTYTGELPAPWREGLVPTWLRQETAPVVRPPAPEPPRHGRRWAKWIAVNLVAYGAILVLAAGR